MPARSLTAFASATSAGSAAATFAASISPTLSTKPSAKTPSTPSPAARSPSTPNSPLPNFPTITTGCATASPTFYTSGDANPRDGRARGFDSVLDLPNFAGGIFSFWDREGIRLTGSGVLLTSPGSLIPNLRSSKDEGQSEFINPGIFLANAGADFNVTPKLKAFANVNFLRFQRTEPLEFLLFQSPIRHTIGTDVGIGVEYRPPLSENIVITGGAAALQPGQGFKDIYTSRTLFSLFASAKFTF